MLVYILGSRNHELRFLVDAEALKASKLSIVQHIASAVQAVQEDDPEGQLLKGRPTGISKYRILILEPTFYKVELRGAEF